ncbi:hypothetical protein Dimus_028850, partial [Dionaea muscipula]
MTRESPHELSPVTPGLGGYTDYLEGKIDEASEDTKTHFELMETKLKMTELDLNINFNMMIDKAETNPTQQIGENS